MKEHVVVGDSKYVPCSAIVLTELFTALSTVGIPKKGRHKMRPNKFTVLELTCLYKTSVFNNVDNFYLQSFSLKQSDLFI